MNFKRNIVYVTQRTSLTVFDILTNNISCRFPKQLDSFTWLGLQKVNLDYTKQILFRQWWPRPVLVSKGQELSRGDWRGTKPLEPIRIVEKGLGYNLANVVPKFPRVVVVIVDLGSGAHHQVETLLGQPDKSVKYCMYYM